MADADAVKNGDVITPGESAPGTTSPGDMSLVGHLTELRNRIVKSLIAVALGSVVGALFWTQIRNVLIAPLPSGQVQVLGPGDAFVIFLRISIITGVILAMPVILWEVWGFIAPGLTDKERRTVRPWIPIALGFFAIGVTIAYVIMPFAVQFLLQFSSQYLNPLITAGPYFDFVTMMFLVFGLIMEFAILLFGLSRVGIVTSKRLSDSRRMAILAIAIFAAAATPGGDLVSPFVLGVTMYILFEGTIVAIRRSGK